MSKKIGICVIGLGIGNAHASSYALMKNRVDLLVCDVNEERLKHAQERYGVKGFTSYKESLQQSYILAPSSTLSRHRRISGGEKTRHRRETNGSDAE